MGIDKRIIELTEVSSLSADEFVHVDSSSGGSKKYNLKNIQDQIDAIPVAQIETNKQNIEANTEDIDELKDDLTAEQTARENADTALQTSINNEKTAREAYGFSVVNGILNVTYTTTEVGGE